MKYRNYQLLALLLLLSLLLLASTGCGNGSTVDVPEEDLPMPEITAPIESSLTAADIKATIDDSIYLDATHMNQGLDCNICHSEIVDDQTPKAPTRDTCLTCHEGTYEALAETTSYLNQLNPHDSHQGQLDCAWCHQVHKPFYNYCNTCHSYDVDVRFN